MSKSYSNIRFRSSVSSIVKNQLPDVCALVARVRDVETCLVERLVDSELELHALADVLATRVRAIITELVVRVVLLDQFNVVLPDPDGDRITNVDHARASALPGGKATVTEVRA